MGFKGSFFRLVRMWSGLSPAVRRIVLFSGGAAGLYYLVKRQKRRPRRVEGVDGKKKKRVGVNKEFFDQIR